MGHQTDISWWKITVSFSLKKSWSLMMHVWVAPLSRKNLIISDRVHQNQIRMGQHVCLRQVTLENSPFVVNNLPILFVRSQMAVSGTLLDLVFDVYCFMNGCTLSGDCISLKMLVYARLIKYKNRRLCCWYGFESLKCLMEWNTIVDKPFMKDALSIICQLSHLSLIGHQVYN